MFADVPETTIQNVIFPGDDIPSDKILYIRDITDNASNFSNGLRIAPNALVSFDTFYNAFPIRPWRETGRIVKLGVRLWGESIDEVEIVHRSEDGMSRTISSCRYSAEHGIIDGHYVEIQLWEDCLADGILFLRVKAGALGACLSGARFIAQGLTLDSTMHLGVVVTHYNRQDRIRVSMERLRKARKEPQWCANISVIIVDNSKNLDAHCFPDEDVIRNENYGGSGGFARGLLHLVDDGSFTHCMFMDDDAAAEPESLRRAYYRLALSSRTKEAVAGTLLSLADGTTVLDRGADLRDGIFHPRGKGENAGDVDTVTKMNSEPRTPGLTAAGWWLFGFAIKDVDFWPFPFFVRGDDVLFTIVNRFDVITMSGIGCFSEPFAWKEGAATVYLGMRSALAIMLMTDHVGPFTRDVLCLAGSWFLYRSWSYRYKSARASLLAFEHVMIGPCFWERNLDCGPILRSIPDEEDVVMGNSAPLWCPPERAASLPRDGILRRLFRLGTMNGHFLPSCVMRHGHLVVDEYSERLLSRVFRWEKVLFLRSSSGKAFKARRDTREFIAIACEFAMLSLRFIRKERPLRKSYRTALHSMCREEFWRSVYAISPGEALPAAQSASLHEDMTSVA